MTTRTYYLPRNRISIMVLNKMIDKIGCSIGDIKISVKGNCLKVPLTCNDKDIQKVEKILYRYDMIGE